MPRLTHGDVLARFARRPRPPGSDDLPLDACSNTLHYDLRPRSGLVELTYDGSSVAAWVPFPNAERGGPTVWRCVIQPRQSGNFGSGVSQYDVRRHLSGEALQNSLCLQRFTPRDDAHPWGRYSPASIVESFLSNARDELTGGENRRAAHYMRRAADDASDSLTEAAAIAGSFPETRDAIDAELPSLRRRIDELRRRAELAAAREAARAPRRRPERNYGNGWPTPTPPAPRPLHELAELLAEWLKGDGRAPTQHQISLLMNAAPDLAAWSNADLLAPNSTGLITSRGVNFPTLSAQYLKRAEIHITRACKVEGGDIGETYRDERHDLRPYETYTTHGSGCLRPGCHTIPAAAMLYAWQSCPLAEHPPSADLVAAVLAHPRSAALYRLLSNPRELFPPPPPPAPEPEAAATPPITVHTVEL